MIDLEITHQSEMTGLMHSGYILKEFNAYIQIALQSMFPWPVH